MSLTKGPETEKDPTFRVDPRTGVREELMFFGPGRERMFGCLHRPNGEPVGGIVICSALLAEFRKNYLREVLVSRLLAEHGFAVYRFHYRGTGNSDGESSDVTFATMLEDTLAAAQNLVDETAVSKLTFLGTRLGSLIGVAAAQTYPGAPLILWEPILDPSRYFREAFRAQMMRELRGSVAPRSVAALVQELQKDGRADILGYPVDRALYESLSDPVVVDVVRRVSGPVLLIQISRARQLSPEYADFMSQCRASGLEADERIVAEEESWWLTNEDGDEAAGRENITRTVEITTEWVMRRFMGGQ